MKDLETLGRLRVNEALQEGLASQAVHRALSENPGPAKPPVARRVRQWFAWLLGLPVLVKRAPVRPAAPPNPARGDHSYP